MIAFYVVTSGSNIISNGWSIVRTRMGLELFCFRFNAFVKNPFKGSVCCRTAKLILLFHLMLLVFLNMMNLVKVSPFSGYITFLPDNLMNELTFSYFLSLQTINFTEPFYAPPVVLVTPKRSDNNNNSNHGSRCNAVTAWVEVRNTLRVK